MVTVKRDFRIFLIVLVSASLLLIEAEPGLSVKSYQAKPEQHPQVKPGEVGERTVPQPAKPESEQPPPDMVGKVPKDLKKAARKKETEKLVPEKHRHL